MGRHREIVAFGNLGTQYRHSSVVFPRYEFARGRESHDNGGVVIRDATGASLLGLHQNGVAYCEPGSHYATIAQLTAPTTEEIHLVLEHSIDRTKPAPPLGRSRLSERGLSMRPSPVEWSPRSSISTAAPTKAAST